MLGVDECVVGVAGPGTTLTLDFGGTRVVGVAWSDDSGVTLECAGGERLHAPACVLAVPLPALVSVLIVVLEPRKPGLDRTVVPAPPTKAPAQVRTTTTA